MPKRKVLPMFSIGDLVRVHAGVSDPDYDDLTIGGWAGTVREVENGSPASYLVRWNVETLKSQSSVYRKRCERDGFDGQEMWLGEDGLEPDFSKFAMIDCGQTVGLGDYEAAVDAILYEYDPMFRRRILKQRQQEDRSLGASLRRLRNQRGLRREDFAPDLSAKTIARIEQGKVKRIQKKTLNTLAEHLDVEPEEIATF